MIRSTDAAFAPIDDDQVLERMAGGNETEVFRSDDQRYVIKLKQDLGGTREQALAEARLMRAAAERFAKCLGMRHSISSYYLLSRDSDDQIQVLCLQPYLHRARVLYDIDWHSLSAAERAALGKELRALIGRAVRHYWRSGSMPDLYGRTSASRSERKRLNSPLMLPWRIWSFLVERNILRSHNLMYTTDRRVVLVDYDFVRRGPLYKAIYFFTRLLLFMRDLIVIKLTLG